MIRRLFNARAMGLLTACAVGLPAALIAPTIRADVLPPGQITLVVPFTPGGTTDLLARRVAQGMSEQLRRSVIVENRPGGGTAVAASMVARAPADGRTILIASNATLAINQHLGTKLNYSPENSFDYVSLLATVPNVVVTRADARWRDLADVVSSSKTAKPATYGSMGTGTSTHIAMEVLSHVAGSPFLHVPYKGSAPALADLMGGHVDMVVDTLVATLPHLREGKLRALAVLSESRSPNAPDIPSAKEAMGRNIDIYSWFGLVVPKGTPPEVTSVLSRTATSVMKNPKVQKDLGSLGVELVGSEPRAFSDFVKNQQRLYGEIISTNNLKLN